MKKHICKLCLEKFPNGRAFDGHMRFHMMNPSIPQKDEDTEESKDQISASSFSSSSKQEDISTPKRFKCMTSQDSTFPVEISSDLVQNSESDTDSSKSKGVEKSRISISKISHDEDAAYCLMMMSTDKWTKEVEDAKSEDFGVVVTVSNPELPMTTIGPTIEPITPDAGPDSLRKQILNLASTSTLSKVRKACGKYTCETCNKVFKSYQALGGHRSNHKKIKFSNEIKEHETEETEETEGVVERKHECPICYRVFGSGQALGGHKRSHVTKFEREHFNLVKPYSRKIDLNLPAPLDDDEETKQMDISVVSDA